MKRELNNFYKENNKRRKFIRYGLLSSDIIGVIIAYGLAYWLRFRAGIIMPLDSTTPFLFYFASLTIFVPVTFLWLISFGVYDIGMDNRLKPHLHRVIPATTLTFVTTMTILFWYRGILFSRWMMFLVALLTIFMLIFNRYIVVCIIDKNRRLGYVLKPAVIIAEESDIQEWINRLDDSIETGLKIVGYYIVGERKDDNADVRYLGNVDSFTDKIIEHIEVVILFESSLGTRENIHIVKTCHQRGIDVYYLPRKFYAISKEVELRDLRGMPVMTVVSQKGMI